MKFDFVYFSFLRSTFQEWSGLYDFLMYESRVCMKARRWCGVNTEFALAKLVKAMSRRLRSVIILSWPNAKPKQRWLRSLYESLKSSATHPQKSFFV